jgi:hypothetical protein
MTFGAAQRAQQAGGGAWRGVANNGIKQNGDAARRIYIKRAPRAAKKRARRRPLRPAWLLKNGGDGRPRAALAERNWRQTLRRRKRRGLGVETETGSMKRVIWQWRHERRKHQWTGERRRGIKACRGVNVSAEAKATAGGGIGSGGCWRRKICRESKQRRAALAAAASSAKSLLLGLKAQAFGASIRQLSNDRRREE